MARSSALHRLERLDQLAARLKSEEAMSVAALAEEFGVSPRTLSRDIALLRDRGLPVDADRGRGGGVRLHRLWGIGRIALSPGEAVDLLVSLAVAEQVKSPLLMANLAPVRRKLIASFSPESRHRIARLRARILIGPVVSASVLTRYAPPEPKVVEALHLTFLMRRAARIRYRSDRGETTTRVIEPHYLMLNFPVWYVLAWDRLRGGIRTFRCDRTEAAEALEEGFSLRPEAEFRAALAGQEVTLL